MQIRDLHTIEEFKQVVALEREIWAYTDDSDLVTVPVFIFTVKRGASLLGAFDDAGQMVGFAYAVVGMKHGKPMLWSHMTGVLPAYRGGLGLRLKLEQRQRALAEGYDLIEWTFDPMQAMNAHFNFAKLGAVSDEYAVNIYGESTSVLHRGTPTDRLIAAWNIADAHVRRRIEHAEPVLRARSHELSDAPPVNACAMEGGWLRVTSIDLALDARRVWIEIPSGFTEMQQQDPGRALEWRLQLRQMLQAYFARDYRAVDFVLQREQGLGRYLLAKKD